MITRRKLLTLAPVFLAAPAIIRVADLMPIRAHDARVWFRGKHLEWVISDGDWDYRVIKGPFRIVG